MLRRAIARLLEQQRGDADAGGGMPWGDMYPDLPAPGTTPRRYLPEYNIASSIRSQVLVLANPARHSVVIVNDSTAILYVAAGPTASSSGYTWQVAAGGTLIIEPPDVYRGVVSGVWAAANGNARVTEQT